jgi:hypothetical protein
MRRAFKQCVLEQARNTDTKRATHTPSALGAGGNPNSFARSSAVSNVITSAHIALAYGGIVVRRSREE